MTDPYAYFYDNKVSNRKGTASPFQSPQQPQDIWYSGGNAATTAETAGATEFGGTQQQSFFNGQIDPQNAPSPPNQQPFYPNYFAGQQQQPNLFIPSMPTQEAKGFDSEFDDIANEPPLLEELGVNFQHIWLKTMAVLNPLGIASAEVIADQDLAGPLVFCLLFGASLLLHGKVRGRTLWHPNFLLGPFRFVFLLVFPSFYAIPPHFGSISATFTASVCAAVSACTPCSI
ncbi:hypothetical protein niasHS_014531 [Heterodera schachtii]|uniref:Protein YIPF n=1 Tax=Heterodera schachtii TaxID=97005 RepID=A0ABD2IC00_HETSC